MCVYIFILVQYTNTYLTVEHMYIHIITCGNLHIFVHIHVYLYPDADAGEGVNLVRGDTHKQSDFDAAGGKKERHMQTKRQGKEVTKMEFEDTCTESCVKRCTHCPRIFA